MTPDRDCYAVNFDEIDGVAVAHKRCRRPDATSSLRYETEVLSRIDHPGIVQLVSLASDRDTSRGDTSGGETSGGDTSGGENVMTTARAGNATLATMSSITVSELIRLAAGTALTVAELHRLGWAHGAIEQDHLIVGPGGRITLCSLRRATRVSGPLAPAATADAAALADVLESMVPRVAGEADSDALVRLRRAIRNLRHEGAPALVAMGDLTSGPTARAQTRLPVARRVRPTRVRPSPEPEPCPTIVRRSPPRSERPCCLPRRSSRCDSCRHCRRRRATRGRLSGSWSRDCGAWPWPLPLAGCSFTWRSRWRCGAIPFASLPWSSGSLHPG